MTIKSIELIGYKRLSLTNIHRLYITFTERLQLILGTNGSGKSSLVRELSPLPAHPSNYTKTGSKTVVKEHQGRTYVMRSTMHPSPRHSFYKDGIELNPGGTQSVQRELCQQEFGITPEIQNLLTNKERFTQMSPRRRRDWFTLLADVDYDYALEVFGRLRDRAKQLNSALVLAKKRLVVEAGRLRSEAEQELIRKEIEQLHHELEVLQSERAPITLNPHELRQTEQRLTEDLRQMEIKVLRLRGVLFGKIGYGSLEEIDAALQRQRDGSIAVKTLLTKAVADHETLQKQLNVLQQAGAEGIKDLERKVADQREIKSTILSGLALPDLELDQDVALSALYSVRDVLSDVFQHLPANEDRRFSQQRFKEETDYRLKVMERKVAVEREYADALGRRKVMESHKALGSTCCPKCGHTWIAGYSDEQYQNLQGRIEHLEKEIGSLDAALAANKTELDAIESYRLQYSTYSRTVKAWPVLQPFWDLVFEAQFLTNAPRKVLVLMEQLEHDLKLVAQAKRHQVEHDRLRALIEQAKQLDGESLGQVTQRLQESDETIARHTTEVGRLAQEQVALQSLRRNLVEYLALGEKITQAIDALHTNAHEQIEHLRLEAIHTSIRQVQVALAERTKTLSEIELQKRTISDLTANIAEMEQQELVAKRLVAELSPTDGLIAEGLLGSIQHIVAEMNSIIRKIWSYPLEVQACDVSTDEGAELDYRFPMLVAGEPVEDVGEGSTGQQEIVDLAFRIVAMHRLNLVEPALVLDEFGAGFDESHRKSAAFVIQSLIEQQMFCQVFMVSHYEASYGALTQTEILALCAENVTLPAGATYNQHAVIEN